jgi:hypothetical protein
MVVPVRPEMIRNVHLLRASLTNAGSVVNPGKTQKTDA